MFALGLICPHILFPVKPQAIFVFIAIDLEEMEYFALLFGCALHIEESTITSHEVLKGKGKSFPRFRLPRQTVVDIFHVCPHLCSCRGESALVMLPALRPL